MMPKAIVHRHLHDTAKTSLLKEGFDVLEIPPSELVDSRIAEHPDIQLFVFNDSIFVHPDIPNSFTALLPKDRLTVCRKKLGAKYPMDCAYNIAYTGRFALFKKEIIPDEIVTAISDTQTLPVYIPQGYARCSTIIADTDSIITEDAGIHAKALEHGIDSLLIPHGLVPLKGFTRGFIGGATGIFGDTVYFTGKVPKGPVYDNIKTFLSKKQKRIVELSEYPAEDFGSILFV